MSLKYTLRFKKTVMVVFLSLSLIPVAQSDGLIAMYDLALQNDPSLKRQQASFAASSEVVNLERSARLPQITGSASYGSSHSDVAANQDTSRDNASVSLALEQSLLNFQTPHLIKRGEVDEQIAKLNLADAEQSLLLRTATAYFDVLNAFEQLRSAQAEEDALLKDLEQTQERFDVGLIPINDVLDAQANYDNALAEAIAADATLGVQRENLAGITGEYAETLAPLATDFVVPSLVPDNRQEWIDLALANNLVLKVRRLEIDAATHSHEAVKNDDALTLNGELGLTHNEDFQANRSAVTSSIGITLTAPLYAGGRYKAQDRQSAQQIVQAQEQLTLDQRNIVRETRSLFLSLKSSKALLNARLQAINSSQSALESSQAGYDAGIRDLIDVINAQRDAFQAQRNYSTALYTYLVDSLSLKATAGLLTVDDLQVLDQALDKNALLRLNDFSIVN